MREPPPSSTTKAQLPVGQAVLIIRGVHRDCTGVVFRQTTNGVEIQLRRPHKGKTFTVLPCRQLIPAGDLEDEPAAEDKTSFEDGKVPGVSRPVRIAKDQPESSETASKSRSPKVGSSSVRGTSSSSKISEATLGMIQTLVVLGERRSSVWSKVADQILADIK